MNTPTATQRIAQVAQALATDTSRFIAALASMSKAAGNATAALAALERRQQVTVAGMEARWYTRGALHPAYATPEARNAQARHLARMGLLTNLTDAEAAGIAAAFLAGWATHRATPPARRLAAVTPPAPSNLPWHRHMAGRHLVVTQEGSERPSEVARLHFGYLRECPSGQDCPRPGCLLAHVRTSPEQEGAGQ